VKIHGLLTPVLDGSCVVRTLYALSPPGEASPVPIHWETGWSLAGRGQWEKRNALRQPEFHPRFLGRLVLSVVTARDLSRYS